jgi:HlyD family secretion protein
MSHVLEQEQTRKPVIAAPHPPSVTAPHTGKPARARKPWMWAAALLTLVVIAAAVWKLTAKPAAPAYATAKVERGDVAKTISATGKLQAVTTVQVGSQVSGNVSEIYVDFNSQVKKGQVIARLDPSQLQAQLTQAQANLTSAQMSVQSGQASLAAAEAGVEAAAANVQRLRAAVADAQLNLNRTRELVEAGVSPKRDLEVAQNAYNQAVAQQQQGSAQVNQARAQANAAKSQVAQARAQVAQSSAAVQLASVNLEKTVIRAPIDGVVTSRNVDVGQTVAASLQAPVLFLIAHDLTQMQVLANIDEADVGQLKNGNSVTFTVDAFPREDFHGQISQIRLEPQAVQNVVTYTAVIDVANPEQKLKPGMTANITATVEERENVLTVPASALRFTPAAAAGSEPQAAQPNTRSRRGGQVVYRVEGNELKPVQVRLGLTNGIVTEVVSGELKEGDTIAIPSVNNARQQGGPQASPFGGGRPRGGVRR